MRKVTTTGQSKNTVFGSGTLGATGPCVCPLNSVKFSSKVVKFTVPGGDRESIEKPDNVPEAGTSKGTSKETH